MPSFIARFCGGFSVYCHISVIHKEVRQEVYEKTRKVAYTSRAERWPHWEPHPPSADNDSRIIQDIVDYAAILSLEDAVAFFVRLISHWIKKCSVEAVLADLKTTGRGKHINRPLTESEVIAELQHSLDLSIFDYESMDA